MLFYELLCVLFGMEVASLLSPLTKSFRFIYRYTVPLYTTCTYGLYFYAQCTQLYTDVQLDATYTPAVLKLCLDHLYCCTCIL